MNKILLINNELNSYLKSKYLNRIILNETWSIYYSSDENIFTYKDSNYFVFINGYIFNTNNDISIKENQLNFIYTIIKDLELNSFKYHNNLDGKFLFIIYIKNEKKIIFFTDVFGSYPFFYNLDDLWFSNTMFHIENNKKIVIDRYHFIKSIMFREFVGDEENTIYSNVKKVDFYSIYEIKNNHCFKRMFFNLKINKYKYNELLENSNYILNNTVKTILKYYKNPVFDLSGGLDSSTLVQIALEQKIDKPINSWRGISNILEPSVGMYENIVAFKNNSSLKHYNIDINNCYFLDSINDLLNDYNEHFIPNTSLLFKKFLDIQEKFMLKYNFDCGVSGFFSEQIFTVSEPYFIADLFKAGKFKLLINKLSEYCRIYKSPIFPTLEKYFILPLIGICSLSFYECPIWMKNSLLANKILIDAKIDMYKNIYLKNNWEINSVVKILRRSIIPFGIPITNKIQYLTPFLNRGLFELIINSDRNNYYENIKYFDRDILRKIMSGRLDEIIIENTYKTTSYNREIYGVRRNFNNLNNLFKHSIIADTGIVEKKIVLKSLDSIYYDKYPNPKMRDHIILNIFTLIAHEVLLQYLEKKGNVII